MQYCVESIYTMLIIDIWSILKEYNDCSYFFHLFISSYYLRWILWPLFLVDFSFRSTSFYFGLNVIVTNTLSLVTEPQTEIEYQPIGEVRPSESNGSSVLEVSSQPLPSEPEHPQVVTPEQVTKVDPSQSIVPTPVSHQLPPIQPVSSRPTGNETEPLPSPLVEPGYP